MHTVQPAELRIIDEELGLFIISGSLEEVAEQQAQLAGYQDVRPSTMDRYLQTGRVSRSIGRISLF